jgi:hypothetical protein
LDEPVHESAYEVEPSLSNRRSLAADRDDHVRLLRLPKPCDQLDDHGATSLRFQTS